MKFLRAATISLEVAHMGLDGILHGHSLVVEVWTENELCLDAWRARIEERTAYIEGQLEKTISGRTFEDVAVAILSALPEAVRVIVTVPTLGHRVEATR
jgi:hypothetical protein